MIYKSIEAEIQAATLATAIKYPDHQILFVGHSLGGALAQIAALDFHNANGMDTRISVFSYASPRIGNTHFAQYMNQAPFSARLYRINFRGDPIPRLPLQEFGFEHAIQQYNVLENHAIIKCKNDHDTGESSTCFDDFRVLRISKHRKYFGWNGGC